MLNKFSNSQYQSWKEALGVFGELGSAVVNGQVLLLNENDASNVHANLRDLASITQALARLYTFFIGKFIMELFLDLKIRNCLFKNYMR